jgi:hypothetical protein
MEKWLRERHPKGTPTRWLFHRLTKPEEQMTYSSFSESLAEMQKGSGLPRITPHSFRAGFATTLINNGADMADIQASGLWRQGSSVEGYALRADANKAKIGLLIWGPLVPQEPTEGTKKTPETSQAKEKEPAALQDPKWAGFYEKYLTQRKQEEEYLDEMKKKRIGKPTQKPTKSPKKKPARKPANYPKRTYRRKTR